MPFTVQLDLDARTQSALTALAARIDTIPGLETVGQIGDLPLAWGIVTSPPSQGSIESQAR